MKNKINLVILLLLLGISKLSGITNDFVFTYENEFRLHDTTTPALYYDHNDIQIKYLVNPYFDLFSDYRLIFQNKGNGFSEQNMFLEGFNLKYPAQKWGKMNLRSRLEIGLNQDPVPTSWLWNEFPKYNTPWKWTKYEINPFIADEMFFDVTHDMNLVKNRIYGGVDWKLTSKIKGGTYFYRESKQGKWSNSFVTQIKFEF